MSAQTQAPAGDGIFGIGVKAAKDTMQAGREVIARQAPVADAFLRQGGLECIFSSARQDWEAEEMAEMSDGSASRLVHGIATTAQGLNGQNGGAL